LKIVHSWDMRKKRSVGLSGGGGDRRSDGKSIKRRSRWMVFSEWCRGGRFFQCGIVVGDRYGPRIDMKRFEYEVIPTRSGASLAVVFFCELLRYLGSGSLDRRQVALSWRRAFFLLARSRFIVLVAVVQPSMLIPGGDDTHEMLRGGPF
jgi:hypothetical protein